jgi:ribonuclease P protein component
MIYLYEKTNIPCLAFAIPKSVGTAVQRNKIRRQYREIFTKIVKSDPRKVAQGNYLVKVHSTHSENSKNETVLTKILNELYEYSKKQK